MKEEKYELLIEGMLAQGCAAVPGYWDTELVAGLRQNALDHLAAGRMQVAGVGQKTAYQHNEQIRGDSIKWIEPDSADVYERAFNEQLRAFVSYLNQTCYTGITDYECHYAAYAPGTFYRRHRDQFQQDKGRRFSLVTYLNTDWLPENGGHLVAYVPGDALEVLPMGGTQVFFRSDEVEHEVKMGNRLRLSIAGWLKRG